MGRGAAGVRGMRLKAGDAVVSVSVARDDATMLLITERGYGKRTEMDNFRPKHRGGQGVTAIKISEDKGMLVASRAVGEDDEILLVASNGVLIRVPVDSISVQGAYATGVKVMAVPDDHQVAAVAPVLTEEEDDDTEIDTHLDEPAGAGTHGAGGIVGPELEGPSE